MNPTKFLLAFSVIMLVSAAFFRPDASAGNHDNQTASIENVYSHVSGDQDSGTLHFAILPVTEFPVYLPAIQNSNSGFNGTGWVHDKRQGIRQNCRNDC